MHGTPGNAFSTTPNGWKLGTSSLKNDEKIRLTKKKWLEGTPPDGTFSRQLGKTQKQFFLITYIYYFYCIFGGFSPSLVWKDG